MCNVLRTSYYQIHYKQGLTNLTRQTDNVYTSGLVLYIRVVLKPAPQVPCPACFRCLSIVAQLTQTIA